ncbi:MAG: V-type ATP synthase subunit D [Cyclobacteriaceae bacterium]|nr:V-type ATP synthase subunit D [Cyclobacteriaceae bacterium HetDA_MAG_MS6]
MALKFHYNKTTIQQFRRQLAIRENALPILKNKETALRKEEKQAKQELRELEEAQVKLHERLTDFQPFWGEFPSILSLDNPGIHEKKIVGVKVPDVGEISFLVAEMSWKNLPAWIPAGIDVLQQAIKLGIEIHVKTLQTTALNTARKKTTQKVNLYEKVQIPAYEEAILKIKRFLEDKENISKAGQKIVKKRKRKGVVG